MFTVRNKSIWLGQQFERNGQKQLLKPRIAEHKRAVALFDHDSEISCYVHENNHQIDFNAVNVVGHEPIFNGRLFLDAWLAIQDPHSKNGHIAIPEVYKSTDEDLTTTAKRLKSNIKKRSATNH